MMAADEIRYFNPDDEFGHFEFLIAAPKTNLNNYARAN